MSCPSWQWHRTGSSWSPVRTLPVAPLWCDLGFVPNSLGNSEVDQTSVALEVYHTFSVSICINGFRYTKKQGNSHNTRLLKMTLPSIKLSLLSLLWEHHFWISRLQRRILSPSRLIRDFGADKPSTTCWSGCISVQALPLLAGNREPLQQCHSCRTVQVF